MIAWRSWCGFDNALTNSDAWMGLQDFAEAEGLTLYQALQQVGNAGFGAKEPFLRARTLAEKWRSGQDFLEKNATRRGFGLMKAIGAEGISEFEAVAADMVGDETAKTLLELEQAAISDPVWTRTSCTSACRRTCAAPSTTTCSWSAASTASSRSATPSR